MKRLHALALFSLASLTGCGNDDLVLSLSDIPAGVERVEILASLDGRPFQSAYTNGLSSSVVLDLPSGSQGNVTATLNGLESRGCRTATAQVEVHYQGGGGRPTVVPVSLVSLAQPECPLSVQVTGAGEVSSTPSGIRCSEQGPASACRAYLRDGQQVQLSAKPQAGSYVIWSEACSGLGGCVVQMNGQVKVNATFKPTVQCTQPSCWTRDAVASDTVGLKLLNAIWGTSADNIWASSQFGSFYHYDGNTWSAVQSPDTSVNIRDIWGSGPNDIWACGNNSIFHYNGARWEVKYRLISASSYLTSIHGTSQTDVWAVGEKVFTSDIPLILHYNGSTWSESIRPANNLYGVLGVRPDLAWAVGSKGTVLKWDGLSWASDTGGSGVTTQTLRSLYATADSSVWAVGYDTVLHFDGSSWALAGSGTLTKMQEISGLWGTSDGNLWAVGSNTLILHRGQSGWGVDSFNTTMPYTFQGIWGANPQDIWAVGIDGSRGVFYHYVPH